MRFHRRDSAHRFFHTLPSATRQNLELSITALPDRFCNPQPQEKTNSFCEFDSKTDILETSLETLQTKATEACLEPNSSAVAPIDIDAVDAATEQARCVAQKYYVVLKKQDHFKIGVNLAKRSLAKYVLSWLRDMKIPQLTTCVFCTKTVVKA